LASVIAERSEASLQLKELETLLADDVAAAPLTQVIDELGKELQSLQAELAEERAVERELIRARDLAWETYSTLELKADELSISMGMKDVEVRFASPAVEPIKPVGRNKLFNVIVAAALGFMLSVGVVFVIHYVNPEYDLWKEMTAFLTRKR
jgi:LPS O-antigen subunit length determinant protein (WzzB/FepE family)